MKKKDTPQDQGPLTDFTDELCYVKDEAGNYETVLSAGWDVKKEALDNAWDEINERIKFANEEVKAGRKSPLFYYMEKSLMDYTILAAYVKRWKFTVKRHMKPNVFAKLNKNVIDDYANIFEISSDELINFKGE